MTKARLLFFVFVKYYVILQSCKLNNSPLHMMQYIYIAFLCDKFYASKYIDLITIVKSSNSFHKSFISVKTQSMRITCIEIDAETNSCSMCDNSFLHIDVIEYHTIGCLHGFVYICYIFSLFSLVLTLAFIVNTNVTTYTFTLPNSLNDTEPVDGLINQ